MQGLKMADDNEERKQIEAARNGMLLAEKHMKLARKALKRVAKINAKDKREREANAAFVTYGRVSEALGKLQVAHGLGTEYLFDYWPDLAQPHDDGGLLPKGGHR